MSAKGVVRIAQSQMFVEKPPHINAGRMHHISDSELFAAINGDQGGLNDLGAAVAVSDWQALMLLARPYRDAPGPVLVTNSSGKSAQGTVEHSSVAMINIRSRSRGSS